jgi:DNA invertase Pin-like site-specific DNA recombinase
MTDVVDASYLVGIKRSCSVTERWPNTEHGTYSCMASRKHSMNAAIAVAYLRASTEDQLLGRDGERRDIERWAAMHGVTIASWHVDQGVSGGDGLEERPALLEAVGALKAHRAGLLLVKDRTRLARDVMVAAAIDRHVEGLGARVLSADGAGNGTSPVDGFVRTMLDASSALHRATIRANTKQALAAKKVRGERVGGVPYGYVATADGRLTPDASEQAVIAKAAALRATGLSVRAVVEELEVLGLVNRAGKPFGVAAVHAMTSAKAA